MRSGVSTASLFLRKNNEQALPFLHNVGVKTAEVFLTSFSEYDEEFGRLLNSVKGDLELFSAHVLNTQFEPQLFAVHERVRADAYAWLDRALKTMQAFGATHYTFHGTARVKKASRSGENDDFSSMRQNFSLIAERCARYNVQLCLENVEWSTYNRVGVFSELAPAVPTLGGVLDIKQARISGVAYADYLREMGERLTHVHISDANAQGKMCLPGCGVFDFSELIDRLKDAGFNGPLLIEAYKKDYAQESELKVACEYIDELLYKKNCLG